MYLCNYRIWTHIMHIIEHHHIILYNMYMLSHSKMTHNSGSDSGESANKRPTDWPMEFAHHFPPTVIGKSDDFHISSGINPYLLILSGENGDSLLEHISMWVK